MDVDRSERKTAGSDLPASVSKMRGINADKPEVNTVLFDEMRSCVGARRDENRRSVWIWTAVVEEWDGSRRADFNVGQRDMETWSSDPKAAKYRSGHCEAYSPLHPQATQRGRAAR